MVVSHDREFLARTVNAVLEIDEHTREATFVRRQLGFICARKSGRWRGTKKRRGTSTARRGTTCWARPSGKSCGPPAGWPGSEKRRLTRTKRNATSASTAPSNWPLVPAGPRKRWNAWRKWKSPGSPGISTTPCKLAPRAGTVVAAAHRCGGGQRFVPLGPGRLAGRMGGPNGGYGRQWFGQDHPGRRHARPSAPCGRCSDARPQRRAGRAGPGPVAGPGRRRRWRPRSAD